MAFDLAINVNAFPRCIKCGGDMALAKVIESETESYDKGMKLSITRASGSDTDEKKAVDVAVFVWKCGCGSTIEEKVE